MNILVTGAQGFVGKNLVANLRNIAQGKNRTRPNLHIDEIYEFDLDTDPALLGEYCGRADFVYHLAGVNRPRDPKEFYDGNTDLTTRLCGYLAKANNRCPILMTSSVQSGNGTDYGKSKALAEEQLRRYEEETGAEVLLTRMPGIFGK